MQERWCSFLYLPANMLCFVGWASGDKSENIVVPAAETLSEDSEERHGAALLRTSHNGP